MTIKYVPSPRSKRAIKCFIPDFWEAPFPLLCIVINLTSFWQQQSLLFVGGENQEDDKKVSNCGQEHFVVLPITGTKLFSVVIIL